jgi:protein-disulfide isomerase
MLRQVSTGPSPTHSHSQRARAVAALMLVIAVGAISGCAKESAAKSENTPAEAANTPDLPKVLAIVDGKDITLADLPSVAENIAQIDAQYRQQRSTLVEKALDSAVAARMLAAEAAKQGKPVETLLASEAGGSLEPSEVEVAAWYQENPNKVSGRTLEQIRGQIADYLRQKKRKDAADALRTRLMKEQKVTVNFEPYRVAFNNDEAPTIGKAGAPVTLVEFSDFQCPFCRGFAPSLKQIAEKYGDKVQIIYRQYPIPSLHPNAMKAAEASLCAQEQNKFWELHDMMFAEQQALSVSELKQKAGRLGLDQAKFNSCLDNGRYVERVQNDIKEGNRIGVGNSGTPAIFVNGNYMEGGAVPFEVVARAIDSELAKQPQGK